MKDIARRAGVSVVTVSRVLNGKYPNKVSDETRRRVLQIVEELGYRPNISARALRERRTYQIALVTPSIDVSFIAEVVQGIQDVAMDLGYSCLVYVTKSQPALECRIFRAIAGKNVDGVIWLPGPTREKEVDRAARALPLVQILYKELDDVPAVLVDQVQGAYAATWHLLSLGHRRIGNLAGNDRHGRQRLAGYYKALEEAGIAPEEGWVRFVPTSWDGARAEAQGLLSLPNRPTAVLCYSDVVASGVLRSARENRIVVPDELSVIGFDDVDFSRYLDIPLTTVAQPKHELGELAITTLLRRIEGEAIEDRVLIPRLVVRASTISPHREAG